MPLREPIGTYPKPKPVEPSTPINESSPGIVLGPPGWRPMPTVEAKEPEPGEAWDEPLSESVGGALLGPRVDEDA